MGTLHVAFQVVKVVEGHSAPLMQSVAAPTACRPSCHDIAAWEGMGLGNHNRHGWNCWRGQVRRLPACGVERCKMVPAKAKDAPTRAARA